jgi:hypothetical protein
MPLVLIKIVFQDKMVESSWATNRQVQTTDIRSPSTLACNTVRDNQFQSGGWCVTYEVAV